MSRLDSTAAGVTGVVIVAIAALVATVPQSDVPVVAPRGEIGVPAPPREPEPPRVMPVEPMARPAAGTIPLAEIFERVEGGVVSVRVISPDPRLQSGGSGSGFVYDEQGHIITNEHVVDGRGRITVTFLDGRSYNAEIVGVDPFTDVAVIRADSGPALLRPLPIGDSSAIRVGEPVAAIGNPFGLSGSMTSGIVSQLGRLLPAPESDFSIPDIIQIDAPINPGNSGGPLLNSAGEVIGMNTAIQTDTGQFVGIGFAVPSQTMLKVVPRLISDGEYLHPWIGVSGIDIYPDLARALGLEDSRGFLISGVARGGPADKAGLRGSTVIVEVGGSPVSIGGDVILAVDGLDVRKIDDILVHLQREKAVGDSISLRVLRDGAERLVTLTLDERPGIGSPPLR
ncbi:MAG: trypsin-like peptidase domain-containing protein [Thaumarchaeota archaeon]|nr:trypsin-like peptidase domain-containing protein [Nitrososphaerota archaeon]MDD9812969.1 trypsin-like peptidase domain-containing protein [Nitrososphaerota archaeon]MDD9825196.1 trypsin-like peptidase domain-containing protein [Nitrososphaerota archaeon]MDD9842773.1 trypsin-like peptidase domain-containing protein [Nitrososphaerota archaeon]